MKTIKIHIDPWYDLVYHVLSLIPVDPGDASSLFDPEYVKWSNIKFEKYGTANKEVDRTIVQDAKLMASLYAESGKGYLLHSFPLFWNSTSAFAKVARIDFSALKWSSYQSLLLSESISSGINPALLELFRTALWAELENGYLEVQEKSSGALAHSYINVFSGFLDSIADKLPGLFEFRWVLCHPLRGHGRLLTSGAKQPVMVVGAVDSCFGVSETYPVIQGCHEYFVSIASSEIEHQAEFSTQPGSEGYNCFSLIEKKALSLGARFFMDSEWRKEYLEWISRLYPDDPEAAAVELVNAPT